MKYRILSLLLAMLFMSFAAAAEEGNGSGVASASDMTDVIDIVDENSVPVTAQQLNDGVYPVAVDVSSSMFKVVGCEVTVQDGKMTARLSMKSKSYEAMYPGTAEDAARAPKEALAMLEEQADGKLTFTLPIDAFDAGYECAALSARKQLWYPRTLVFRSDSLPLDAWKEECLKTPESLALSDGTYTCDVRLEGAGRASLASPAVVTVQDGKCSARIVFSTSKIDYVIVDGQRFEPAGNENGAAFTVPVAVFDRKLPITVDSTAITPSVEVAYSMTFDAQSIAPQ
ncbi:MAG: hypothetical protein IKE30_07180 [Clostridia bacterium]|nr:hypothetical protein [Clostridia bacterium]